MSCIFECQPNQRKCVTIWYSICNGHQEHGTVCWLKQYKKKIKPKSISKKAKKNALIHK